MQKFFYVSTEKLIIKQLYLELLISATGLYRDLIKIKFYIIYLFSCIMKTLIFSKSLISIQTL